jgi:hypothetical protein
MSAVVELFGVVAAALPQPMERFDGRKRGRDDVPVKLEDGETLSAADNLPPAHDVYRARRKMRTKASPLHG